MIQEHVPDGTFVTEVAKLVQQLPQLKELGRGQHIFMAGKEHILIGKPLLALPSPLKVSTLSAVVDAITKPYWDNTEHPALIHVVSPARVEIVSPVVGEERQRFTYLIATADTPEIPYGQFEELETFITRLLTSFGHTTDRDKVLKHVGALTAGMLSEIADDGISQKVATRSGIQRADTPVFENPVPLAPFRSFAEVDQTISPFVLRLRQKPGGEPGSYQAQATLIEADGGAWRATAIQNIGSYLREKLPEATILA